MRVLHLTISAAPGGRRDAILTLTDHLRLAGVECGLVALRNTEQELIDIAPRLDYTGALRLTTRPTLPELARIARLCRERQAQVVHAHDAASQYVASMLRIATRKLHVVHTFHRTLGIDSEGLLNRVRNSLLLPLVDRVITASEDRRNYFLATSGIPARKVTVIPHGIDLEVFRPDPVQRNPVRASLGVPPDTVLVLAIGHFGPEKGLDQVIQATTQQLARPAPVPWHLAILGTGSAERTAALRALVPEVLRDRITFAGFRTDVPRWLQGADLLVHAPRMESFGLAVIQAMACGVPVIATAVGGVPEVVQDGVTGHLVSAGDLGALSASMAALLTDAATRSRMGDNARARAVERYDARIMATRHLSLYTEILGTRARSGSAGRQ